MSGLIAVPCRPDNARYLDFYRSLLKLDLPEGWEIEMFPGVFPNYPINSAVEKVLYNGIDYLFVVDDDQILRPDTIKRLLRHQVDIVGCNLLFRNPPFNPYLFHSVDSHGRGFLDVFRDRTGLIEVEGLSTGGLLIHSNVLEKLKKPIFETDEFVKTYDLRFCAKAREKGYKLFCDLDCPSGHMVTSVLWPEYKDGKWVTTVTVNNSINNEFPAAIHDDKGKVTFGDA